ncbi:hypothetical protein EV643_10740 [Kribbella sp. VKM Ac-2527]|uniref:Uncharacterized protein n=1 Tax=Kribbella caucasensis TaxID=2512215 RepID=A0A4R6KD74_9ACTN|nr:hypothetical protein [Kribbella sp. VKM Ac-2527]TDO48411.1 hypothetical protein EV643_10740 [Kribbella sp. VKM Ac-2527]
MSARTAALLAWSLGGVAVALTAIAIGLTAAAGTIGLGWGDLTVVMVLVFCTVGILIARRHPRNPIGWIFCASAVVNGLGSLARSYADYRQAGAGSAGSLAEAAASYATVSWIPAILVPATYLPLLFPDGRLLSGRWRPVAWCGVLGIAGLFVASATRPGALEDFPTLTNPYAVDSVVRTISEGVTALTVLGVLVASSLSLILRFRRAGYEQRQQIKWLVWAGALAAATIAIGTAGYELLTPAVANAAILLSVLGLPVATGIGILRHRLYDVDVVINRTIVYGALTVTLAAGYLGSVLLLQLLLRPVTQGSGPAVAVSTLAVAALFRPVRSRIQAGVDRRFFRRRYDAARTLEAFGVRLREQLDLDALGNDLQVVVRDTMQPTQVTLWLRSRR